MHRYWPAKFPGDYSKAQVDDSWQKTYAREIDFTMGEANRQVERLESFVRRHSEYALILTTSMGQAAVDASTIVHSQLYITDTGRFMAGLGVPEGSWTKNRAMLPRYIFRISDSFFDAFRSSLASTTINGVPVQVSELGSDIFQIKLGHENLTDERTIVRMNGRECSLTDLGLANVAIQDESASFAYHIPHGIMLVYDPSRPRKNAVTRTAISTCEIAPTLLANFGVARPSYMRRVAA